jgi:hypothetical protein
MTSMQAGAWPDGVVGLPFRRFGGSRAAVSCARLPWYESRDYVSSGETCLRRSQERLLLRRRDG